jgi:hypothetical protein
MDPPFVDRDSRVVVRRTHPASFVEPVQTTNAANGGRSARSLVGRAELDVIGWMEGERCKIKAVAAVQCRWKY